MLSEKIRAWRWWPAIPLAALAAVASLSFDCELSKAASPSDPNSQHSHQEGAQRPGDDLLSFVYAGAASFFGDPPAVEATATVFLFLITALLAKIAWDQHRTTRRQLRAYVSGRPDFVISFDSTHACSVRAKLRNDGPTPAFRVKHRMGIELMRFPFIPNHSLPPLRSSYSAPMVLFPRDDFRASYVREQPFSAQDIVDIRAVTLVIMVYGEIMYDDVFGQHQWTVFCSYVTADQTSMRKLTSLYQPSDLVINMNVAPMGNDAKRD